MSERADTDLTQSTRRAQLVTPNDGTVFPAPTRGLYIGVAGSIRVMHADGVVATDYPVTVAGSVYPWAVKQVFASGTTADSIVAQF